MERKKKSALYIFGVCILILVAVGFFVTPLAGVFGPENRSAITFGKYRGRAISYIPGNYFAQQVEESAGSIAQPGQSIDNFTARSIWRAGFDAAIVHAAILAEIQQSGIEISEVTLDRRIAQHPNFRGVDGFDVDAYRALNSQERSRFRERERELFLREIYLSDITDGVLVSSSEHEFFRELALEERQIAFTVVTDEQLDDAAVAEYITDNAPLFERLRIGVIEIDDRQRAATQILTQIADDGSNFYEKRTELNSTEEQGLAAESVWFFFYEIRNLYPNAEELEELRTLPLLQPSPLIEYGDEQYAIFLVEEREAAEDVEQERLYQQARIYIETQDPEYLNEHLRTIAEERHAQAEESGDLDSASILNGFEVEASDFFPLNYGNLDLYPAIASDNNGYLDGIERNREFLAQVFLLSPGALSKPISHRENIIIFQLQEVRAVDAEEYEGFNDFYHTQLATGTESGLEEGLVQDERLFDNFDSIYREFIATPEQ